MDKLISRNSKKVKRVLGNKPFRDFDKDAWFYSEEKGIYFIHWVNGICYQFIIPWYKIVK
jgi:hypothetical protein